MKPAGQPKQPGCVEWPKSNILRMLVPIFLCNVNDMRALIGLCLLVMLHLDPTYPFFYSTKLIFIILILTIV